MDAATASRLLGPAPTLTSDPALDKELFLLLATVYRQFIQPWYGRIHADGPLPADVVSVYKQIVDAIALSLGKIDPMTLLLRLVALADQHLTHAKLALDSRLEVYASLNPHFVGCRASLDKYLMALGLKLIEEWVPEAPRLVQALFATVLQTILSASIRALSEPWMIHELVVKLLEPSSDLLPRPQQAKTKAPEQRDRTKLKRKRRLAPQEPEERPRLPSKDTPAFVTTNTALLDFVYNQALTRNAIYSALWSLAWPLHGQFAEAANRFVQRKLLAIDVAPLVATLRNAIFPGGYLGAARQPPTPEIQAALRKQCSELLNKRYSWYDERTFDVQQINQRFLVAALDSFLAQLAPLAP